MDHSSPAPPLPSIPVPTPSQPEPPLGLSLAIEICLSPGCSRDNTRGERFSLFNADNMPRVSEVWGGLMHCLPYHPVCGVPVQTASQVTGLSQQEILAGHMLS